MSDSRYTRRQFLATGGLALLGAACGGGRASTQASPSPAPGSLDALKRGASELSLFPSADQGSPVNPGRNRISFGLVTNQGGVITGGSPKVYLARGATSTALGPFPSTWYAFTGYGQTGDHSPESPIPGTYVTDVDLPSAGLWQMLAVAQGSSGPGAGEAAFPVTTGKIPASLGSKAISVKTPVATTQAKLKEICTRIPPDDMHYISLDWALANGKPTVAVFATPLLCESKLCGPVTDEVLLVFQKVGKDGANFIHVEEFLPGPDLTPPPATLETRSPGFKAWDFQTEPWVVVIDRDGVIRGRMGPGPSAAAEIEAALTPLL